MEWVTVLPTVNAMLNGVATLLLIAGFVLIKRGQREAHKRVMLAALGTSALFLCSYVTYHYHAGSLKFAGQGAARILYFAILIPHVILATVMVPFILALVYRALRGEYAAHKRLARPTWAVWLYVSLTGVLVYLMLYHWFAPATP